jgi:hypothetical protein
LEVEIDRASQKGNQFLLMDVTGKTVYLDQKYDHINDTKISIDVSILTSGMYWLTLVGDNQRLQTAQVVIYQ